ncbi:MAG: UvrD-helicase domain-containing protein [Deltaproteobacteria bacterium]|jgi:ATP-dependent helicase/nuclease subunit A|nr:UvrD-helicase domain-containing protein [Deltaproteobacteria bacterium]
MDRKDNESQLAVLGCQDNFCVTAGAGSGKTGTMVEYIIRHVESDLENNSITRVLALTFSEKAATEISDRVAKGVRERLRAAKREGDPKKIAQWEREFRRLGQAEIGTIHGYAFSLVKSYSHLMGLPMNIGVNPVELSKKDLMEVLNDLLNESNPDLSYLLRLLPLDADNGPAIVGWLQTCVSRMSSWGLSALTCGVKPPKFEARAVFDEFSKAVASAADYVESGSFDESKYPNPALGVRNLVRLLNDINDPRLFPKSPAEPLLAETLLAENVSVSHLPKFLFFAEPQVALLSSWRKKQNHNHKQEINEAFEKLKSYLASVEAVPVTEALVRLANKIPPLLRENCARRGQITFDDILYHARRLLLNDPRIRAEQSAKWSLIIIDEFQDTNRLQADLIAQLIPQSGQGFVFRDLDWPNMPSKLRVVGDPKQSIYRFRGSEPSIMANLQDVLEKGGGKVLPLDTNYRTQPQLIAFFNAFFETILPYDKNDIQKSARPALYQAKPVVCLTEDVSGTRIACDTQASLIVAYLRTVFDGRAGIRVADKGSGGSPESPPRLPVPGDVALLLRRRKNADVFQAALSQAGWPCHTLKGQDLFDIPEITGLASAYLYLCGRSVDLNLAAAISSPLGPVSEETLSRLAWPEAPDRLHRAISWYFEDQGRPWPNGINYYELGSLIRLRRLFLNLKPYVLRRPPGELIETMVEERNLLPLLVTGDGGSADRVRNIQYFIDFMKTLPLSDPNHAESAADIIEMLLQTGLNRGEVSDDFFEGLPDEESINIMTVHRAKGLEFPIVIIPEADVGLPKNTTGLKICDSGRVVVRFRSETLGSKLEPPEFDEFRTIEQFFEREENNRLLYVAATRARDHLIFVGHRKNPPTDSWLRTLIGFERFDEFVEVLMPEFEPQTLKSPQAPQTPPRLPGAPPRGSDDILSRFKTEMILPAPAPEFIQLTVTLYCRLQAAFIEGAADYAEASRIAWSDQAVEDSSFYAQVGPKEGLASAAARGTVFHAVLETSSFDLDLSGYMAMVVDRALWLGFSLTDEEIEFLANKALRFQSCEFGQELKATMDAGRMYRREWPFWLNLPKDKYDVGPLQLSGVIDLFYVNDKGQGRLIDYKLAKPGTSFIYEKQLEIYATAIRKAGFTGDLLSRVWYSGA